MEMQHMLFQQIKHKLNGQSSLVESVSKVLGISVDSAYRRVRGETMIDLEETRKLCNAFGVSLDGLMGIQDDRIIFRSNLAANEEFDLLKYLQGILQNMQGLLSFPEKKLFYECKDIPFLYQFHSRELAAFKYYFWMRFLYQQTSVRYRKYSIDDYPEEIFDVGQRILNIYNCLPSVEFWNLESMQSTLKQIIFFYEIGCFSRKDDVVLLLERLLEFFDDLESVTSAGIKKPIQGFPPDLPGGTFEVYYNDVIFGNNTILVQLGQTQMVYLNHSVFSYAVTTDSRFATHISRFMDTLMKSSSRLSTSNEVERTSFFATTRQHIKAQIQKL